MLKTLIFYCHYNLNAFYSWLSTIKLLLGVFSLCILRESSDSAKESIMQT